MLRSSVLSVIPTRQFQSIVSLTYIYINDGGSIEVNCKFTVNILKLYVYMHILYHYYFWKIPNT